MVVPYISLGRMIQRAQGSTQVALTEQEAVTYDAVLSGVEFRVNTSFGFEAPIGASLGMGSDNVWLVDKKQENPAYPHQWALDEIRFRPSLNIRIGQTVQNTWIWAQLRDGSWGMLEAQSENQAWLQLSFRWSEMTRYANITELLSHVSQTTWNRWFLLNDDRFRYQPPNRV